MLKQNNKGKFKKKEGQRRIEINALTDAQHFAFIFMCTLHNKAELYEKDEMRGYEKGEMEK